MAHERKELAELATRPLPSDWQGWSLGGRWYSIGNSAAVVTIDVDRRCLRAGGNITRGESIGQETYAGRGWVARLHADAVAWLRARETE